MKKITQLNQYLLEKYPSIWNTKIVWILLSAIIVHILFFLIGLTSHQNPRSLQHSNAVNDYFSNGLIYINIIVSLLMLVTWIILMFKNNAFKNFYPQSKLQVFFQFVQYFVIIFACITFYFSYMFGLKLFVTQKYNDDKMAKNIELINKAAPFLSQNTTSYTLDRKLYPQPFFDLYCERDINKIDISKKYFVYYDQAYQYFSVYSKTSYKKDKNDNYIVPEPEKSNKTEVAYVVNGAKSVTFYFKKEVVDLSPYIKTTALSYYNYSDIFYDYQFENKSRYYKGSTDIIADEARKTEAKVNKDLSELLDRNNVAEIEKLLGDFLLVSKELKIDNNLEAKAWAKMVYQPSNFEVKYFIKKYIPDPRDAYDLNYSEDYAVDSAVAAVDAAAAAVDYNGNVVKMDVNIQDLNPEIKQQISPKDYFKKNLTNSYYFSDQLKNVLVNIDTIKTYDYFSDVVHVCIWIAFALSLVIFSLRITGLRPLLFSMLTVGVLILVIVLIGLSCKFMFGINSEFFILYLILVISLIILGIPILIIKKVRKFISSILMTISTVGFPLFILLIFFIISAHQKAHCNDNIVYYEDYKRCPDIFDMLEPTGISWIVLIISFIFMYCYASVLQKWKALPE